MIITKTTTRKYDIYDCAKWQITVGNTISSREKMGMSTRGLNQCFVCKKFLHGTGGHMSRSNFNNFIYGRQVNKGGKLAMYGSKQKRKRIKHGK